jgi:hypothetical protein
MTVVFISSEGTVLPLLTASLAKSHAHKLYEVGDIRVTHAEAAAYLARRGAPRARAEGVVQTIAGGRLVLLRYASTCFESTTDDELRQVLDTGTRSSLRDAGLPAGPALFRALLAHRQATEGGAKALAGKPALDVLLKTKVLAAHPGRTYTFHAGRIETFFQQAMAEADRRAAATEAERQRTAAKLWESRWWSRPV